MNFLTSIFALQSKIVSKKPIKRLGNWVENTSSSKIFENMLETRSLEIQENQGISMNPSYDTLETPFEDILDTVFILGEELKKSCNSSKLTEYKQAVKTFLNLILERAYECAQTRGIVNSRTCLQREYSLIKVIDSRLDSLLNVVLREQSEVFTILAKIDEINGLIINYLR